MEKIHCTLQWIFHHSTVLRLNIIFGLTPNTTEALLHKLMISNLLVILPFHITIMKKIEHVVDGSKKIYQSGLLQKQSLAFMS